MRRTLLLLSLLAVVFSAPIISVLAHGGGQLIAGPERTGPYDISVWVNPPQPKAAETLHFTVGVADPDDGAPVLDAQIMITMQPTSTGGPTVVAEATTEQSVNKLFYETDMRVDSVDRYLVTFEVRGTEGSGQLDLELDVREPSSINWFLLGLGGVVLVLLLGWWRSRTSARSARSAG